MVDSEPNWYLREWMIHLGRKQTALVTELGWLKSRASKFWNGQHSYRRELVNEIAAWLGIQPYELLMPPAEAIALRRLRETAVLIAAEHGAPYVLDLDERAEGRAGARTSIGSESKK